MTDNGWTGQGGQASQAGRGWAAGLRFGDRYEVERLIGEGGWAETYRGRDLLLERVVALKLLRTQFAADPALVDRFEREARIAAAVSHPNVVTVYDYGTQEGTFFIALQFIAGEDLKHHVVKRGSLPVPDATGVTREILLGLGAIHRAGIVHRDVKPQNVLIGDDGIVRITDFGIAHQSLATRVTTHGDAMGTASYMAPEQAQGDEVSPATDIYALGVVLYELLTGRLPFNRGHAMAILLAHLQDAPEPPSQVAPLAGIPAWLEAIVLRAMAKNPVDRYASAGEMLDAVNAAGRGVSPAAQTQRFAGSPASIGATTKAMPGVPGAATHNAETATSVMGPRFRGGDGEGPPPAPPPVAEARGPSRWARNVAILFVVLIALAVAGVAAANLFDENGDGTNAGDDESATATVRSIPAMSTATEEPEPDGEPTDALRPTATETEAPEPTDPPEATAEPTETPAPTTVPTDVPTETPTEVPTAPPTPTEVPDEPTETPVPVDEGPPIEQVTEPASSGGVGGSVDPIVLSADSWSGGAGKKKDRNPASTGSGGGEGDVASVEARSGPKSEAELEFSLSEIPAAGVRIEVQTRIERPEDGPALLVVAVNEAATAEPIDLSGSGDTWAIVDIPVPAEVLVVGQNRIVMTAQEATDRQGRAVVILLGTVTVTRVGGVGTQSSEDDAESFAAAEETPEPVVEQDERGEPDPDGESDTGGGEPTIAPVQDY